MRSSFSWQIPFLFALYLSPALHAKAFWDGWSFRTDFGVATKRGARNSPDGERRIEGPMLEYGFEHGWVFEDQYYLGVDATWNIFYPDSFVKQRIDPLTLFITPIIHFHAGYIFEDDSLLTVGSAYLWAFHTTYRRPFNETSFWELKFVKWLDEPVDGDLPFHKRIHDMFFTGGVGFKL